ncbi:MAG: group II intron maturase-specific domain-containing protein [Acidobacteriota bacterium]
MFANANSRSELREWIEEKIETWMGLEINREKTRVVNLKEEGASLDFLGYTFRYNLDLKGRGWKYLNVSASAKSLARERAKLREMTSSRMCFKPLPWLIEELNLHLRGWANYFGYGYPRMGYREINRYTRERLTRHVRRRSQRPFRPPEGVSYYEQVQTDGVGVSGTRFEGVEIALPRNCLRKSEARVFGRAGCGKSARPVRRGESGSCYQTSLTLLLYCLRGKSTFLSALWTRC